MKPIVIVCLVATSFAVSSYWSDSDTKRLAASLQQSLSSKSDLAALHYAASGLKLLKVAPDAAANKAACAVARKAKIDTVQTLYHVSALAADLTNCDLAIDAVAQQKLVEAPGLSAEDLYYALSSASRLGIQINKQTFEKALLAVKETDANTLAYVVNAAALLDIQQGAKFAAKATSLAKGADLVDSQFAQYEGGLALTGFAVNGLVSLAARQGKVSAITNEQLGQFANYLISRKFNVNEAAAFNLLSAIGTLVNNQQQVPVAVSLEGSPNVDLGKTVKVHVSNLFGLPVAVSGVSADILQDEKAVASGVALKKVDAQGLVYELPLDKITSGGFYTLSVTANSQDKRLVGLTKNQLSINVVEEYVVEGLKVGVLEKDEAISGTNVKSVATFSKLGSVLESTHQKKIHVSFALKTKAGGKPVSAHQTFVVFTHPNGAEVMFVAQASTTGNYVLDINLGKAHKDFEGLSGKYTVRLLVGDSHMKTPIDWAFADIDLTVPAAPVVRIPKSQQIIYEPLEEIVHKFREPEKRPPAFVSDVFSIICLAPLGVLLILWFRIGLNFKNMPLSPWVLIFHGGLAAIFGLYVIFWLQLNMFETLKYLAVVASVTFVAGNRVLRAIADKRKTKTD